MARCWRRTSGRPTSRCSRRRSAPTWPAPSPPTAIVEALVARHQGMRWTYRRARRARRSAGPRAARARPRARRPGRAVEPELRRVDAAAVRHGGDRRRARQHQPGLPHARAGLRAEPVGVPDAVRRPVVQDVRLRRHGRGRATRGADAGAGRVLLGGRLGRAGRRRRRRHRRTSWRHGGPGCTTTTRSTSSTRRARRGSRRAPR